MSELKESLSETVALRRCDRCYKKRKIEELVDDPETEGILICPECADVPSFQLLKRENPKEKYNHHFKTE